MLLLLEKKRKPKVVSRLEMSKQEKRLELHCIITVHMFL